MSFGNCHQEKTGLEVRHLQNDSKNIFLLTSRKENYYEEKIEWLPICHDYFEKMSQNNFCKNYISVSTKNLWRCWSTCCRRTTIEKELKIASIKTSLMKSYYLNIIKSTIASSKPVVAVIFQSLRKVSAFSWPHLSTISKD